MTKKKKGMYNVPSFTLARTVGGLLAWWWRSVKGWHDTPLIVLASVCIHLSALAFLNLTTFFFLSFFFTSTFLPSAVYLYIFWICN
jgi:hypothetical protein